MTGRFFRFESNNSQVLGWLRGLRTALAYQGQVSGLDSSTLKNGKGGAEEAAQQLRTYAALAEGSPAHMGGSQQWITLPSGNSTPPNYVDSFTGAQAYT